MTTMRQRLLRSAVAALGAAAVLFISPRWVPEAEASLGGCSVKCADGSMCGGDPDIGEKCTCTCALWGNGGAQCTCGAIAPNTPG
jgi:hypothetical protein